MNHLWEPIVIQKNQPPKYTDDLFQKIIFGDNPCIIIKKFFTDSYCQKISRRISEMHKTNQGNKTDGLVKMYLSSYHNKKLDYFDDSKIHEKILQNIFSGEFDPREAIFKKISSLFHSKKVEVASEDGKMYSSGTIRIHNNGQGVPLHRDNANFDASLFQISKIQEQISCVFHIQNSEAGGDLRIFKRKWTKNDERFREPEFGYSKKTISNNAECAIIRPKRGDLIIINPKFYHEVTPVCGVSKRITLGMFFGFVENSEKILAWA